MVLVKSLSDLVNYHWTRTSLGAQSEFELAAEHDAAGRCLLTGK